MADSSTASGSPASQLDSKGAVTTCPSCGQKNRLAFSQLTAETRCGKCHTSLLDPLDSDDGGVCWRTRGGPDIRRPPSRRHRAVHRVDARPAIVSETPSAII